MDMNEIKIIAAILAAGTAPRGGGTDSVSLAAVTIYKTILKRLRDEQQKNPTEV